MWSDSYQYFYYDFIAWLIFDLVNQRQFSISVDDKVILFCFLFFLYFSDVPTLVVCIITAGVVVLMAVILCTTKKHW